MPRWAQVEGDVVRKSVMSVGWNPFYKNEKRSAVRLCIHACEAFFVGSFLSLQEVHIMHKFDSDFYGRQLRVLVLGYLRPERNFASLGESCMVFDWLLDCPMA